MKTKDTIRMSAPQSEIWNILTDFQSYDTWNTAFILSGEPVFEAPVLIQSRGAPVRFKNARVSGAIAPKYLSISAVSGPGAWWFQYEHVFRIVTAEDGTMEFISEVFCHGMRTRFGKDRIKSWLNRALGEMNAALKREAEKRAGKQPPPAPWGLSLN